MSFDTTTVLMLLVVGNLFVFIFLMIFILSSKLKNPIISSYAAGKLIFFISYILLYYRGVIPPAISIILGNMFILTGIAIEVFCIVSVWQVFTLRRLLVYLVPTLVFSLIFSFFVYADDYIRIAIATLHPFIYLLLGSYLLIFSRRNSTLQIFMGILYFITALTYIGRFYIALFGDHSLTLYSDNFVQLTSYILLFFLLHMGVIYILLSLKEQDEAKIMLINKDINRDNRQLKELNAIKDKFFSIIAHDLKTPIGSLSQLLGVLAENDRTLDPERRQKILDTVYLNSKSSYHLLNNLLLWARTESGQMKYTPQNIDLRQRIEDNIRLLKASAEVKKILITNSCQDGEVFGDLDMLDSTLRNLLSNAIKFTPEKGAIEIASSGAENNMVVVSVRDNGIGIDKYMLTKLFNLDSEYAMKGTNKEGGSGLGLKLCREFVEKNKGKIWVESIEGKGSTFYFSIPALQ